MRPSSLEGFFMAGEINTYVLWPPNKCHINTLYLMYLFLLMSFFRVGIKKDDRISRPKNEKTLLAVCVRLMNCRQYKYYRG